jgi:hypothetical protein
MLLTNIDNDDIYTFNQYNRLKGRNNISVGYSYVAQLCGNNTISFM